MYNVSIVDRIKSWLGFLQFILIMRYKLAYGENKDQSPAHLFRQLFSRDPLALWRFKVVAGEPSYISLADTDAALRLLCRLAETFEPIFRAVPYIVVICKHGNPCGAAYDWSDPKRALIKALLGDPIACMGGELITNFPIDDELSKVLFFTEASGYTGRPYWKLDVIIAPDFSAEAVQRFKQGKGRTRRLLANPELYNPRMHKAPWLWRMVRGGALRQRPQLSLGDWLAGFLVRSELEHDSLGELILADSICREANSNAVVLIKNNMLIGRGFGQQDRIACVQLCLFYARRAGHDTQGAVFGSDGFFPFAEHKTAPDPKELRQALGLAALAEVPIPDKLDGVLAAYAQWDNREGPELLVAAGCQGGVVPGDGEQLGAVRAYFKKHGLTVVYLPPEHRAFSGH